jgi:hypothetical protein
MEQPDKIKKYHLDKIAFLGMFGISLLAAWLIIAAKSANMPQDPEKLLEAGSKIVAEIKNRGIASFLEGQSQQNFFVLKLKNSKDQVLGFSMDTFVKSEPNSQFSIISTSLLYLKGRPSREEVVFFQSDNSFDHFIWKTEPSYIRGKSGIELTADGTGVLTVTDIASTDGAKSYELSPAAIPEIFYEQMLAVILRSDYKEVALDIIEGDGAITTTFISKVKIQDVPYALNVQFLNGRGFSEQVQFDEQMRISKRVLRQNGLYLFERVSREYIISEFPERSEYILQNNDLADQNQI